ncbi:carbohydrate ABC transporter permease [Clostridiisalibacter paucivorans]|uniref:carbohydrate ABC transporter permease n=1 Tax=Clostridiisalibacter paucivorans TaxID=408753 RepID=UPI00047CF844|nr:carbohydrate ABC transporter permease [Clostridiisalibacter paucivorans]
MKKRHYFSRSILFLIAFLFAVLFILPTLLTITNSFMSQWELSANYGKVFSEITSDNEYTSEKVNLKLIPDMVSFKQYFSVLLQSPDYLFKFWNSAFLVIPIVVGQVVMATFAAYTFYRCSGRVYKILFFIYIILMLMPYQVMLVPNYLVADWTGLLDNRWSVILPGIFAPFSVFLLTKFMRRIPEALIESAKIDGATEWKIFTKICIPQCYSAIYSVAILAFIDNWNMVEQPIILLSDIGKHPLSVYLSNINTEEIGLAFAVATIYMIPPLLLFLHGEKYLVEGITHSGSVKG